TYRNWELLIVDDASVDGSIEIAEAAAASDNRIRVIKLARHTGVSGARNIALDASHGDLIGYLDSDNTWLEGYLSASVGAFRLLHDAGAVYSGQYIYGNSDIDVPTAVRFGPLNRSLLRNR